MGSSLAAMAMSAFAMGSGAPGSTAQASIPPGDAADAVRTYTIPAGSVADALSAFADANGYHLLYDTRLTQAMATRGLAGRYSPQQGLGRLLAGTGLSYRFVRKGRDVSIILAQAATGTQSDAGAVGLPPIDVNAAQGDPTGTGPGESGGRFTGYNAVDAVAATKTDTPILQTPVSVNVVQRETLDDQQDITLQQAIVGNVPGVTFGQYPDRADFFIRGFDNNIFIYYNGLLVNNPVNFDTSNIQSIEVLKGPGAILFGRVEPGGLIWIQSKRPQEIPYYSFETQAGGFGTTRTTVDATGPLTADKTWLYRINADFSRSNMFTDFLYNKNISVTPSVTFQPIEQFKLFVEATYAHITQTTDYGNTIVLPGGTAPAPGVPSSRYLGDPFFIQTNPDQQKDGFLYYDWTFKFLPGWALTNRGSYLSQWEFYSSSEFSAGPTPTSVSTFNQWGGYEDYNLAENIDLTGKFATGPVNHSVLLGVDLYNTRTPLDTLGFYNSNTIDIYNPQYFPSSFAFNNPNNFYFWTGFHQNWKGIYAQDLLSAWDDSVHLLIGGRYDWASYGSSFSFLSPSDALSTYNPATGTGTFNALDKAFSPRVALLYQPQPWLSFYGNFTEGFGQSNNVNAMGQPLPPQKSLQWEGGAKAEFFDKKLSATLAFFDIDKSNIPTPSPSNPSIQILTGLAESKGVEASVTGKITDNWSIIANYTHQDVRVLESTNCYTTNPCVPPNAAEEVSLENPVVGNWLPSTPANYGNIWLKYTADGNFTGLNVGGGLNIVGSQWGDNANSFKLPEYTLVNGMISYRFPWEGAKVTAQLNVKNLLDTTWYQSAQTRTYIFFGAPRSILASLRLEF